MKNTLIIAATVLFAGISAVNAASINWALGAGAALTPLSKDASGNIISDVAPGFLNGATVLFFMGDSSSMANVGGKTFQETLADGTYATAYGSMLLGSAITEAPGRALESQVTSTALTTGVTTSFFVVILFDSTIVDSSSKDGNWFNISQSISKAPYNESALPPDPSVVVSFASSLMGGWQAVPEPATAALALAGLALLIRRRK